MEVNSHVIDTHAYLMLCMVRQQSMVLIDFMVHYSAKMFICES